MTQMQSEIAAPCPWCGRGETLADTTADIRVSCHCSVCGKYYRVDFNNMRVSKIKPKPRKSVRTQYSSFIEMQI